MGSSGYRAPELIDSSGRYTNKVDIWAMGCVLYELVTRERAFKDDWEVFKYLHSGTSKEVVLDLAFDEGSTQAITSHIVTMLQIDSSVRPSASKLSQDFRLVSEKSPLLPRHLAGASLYSRVGLGDIEGVKILLDANAGDVNEHGFMGNSALTFALSRKGSIDIALLLLERGADVNAKGGKYGNPLQAASLFGHEVAVRLLLEKGADVNAEGGEYGSALQAASCAGNIYLVRLLLLNGADVNAQGGLYDNALSAATVYGYADIRRLLLEYGATPVQLPMAEGVKG